MNPRSTGRPWIRTALVSVAVLLGLSRQAHALPVACATDSLENYLLLAGGCSIGTVVFDDFTLLLPLPTGSDPIDPRDVMITPSNGPTSVALAFNMVPAVQAGANETEELLVGYNVSGSLFNRATLTLAGGTPTDDASVSGIENYCVGAPFSLGCPQLLTIMFDPGFDSDTLSDTSPFGPAGLVGVVLDIAVGAGITGTAGLTGPVTTEFSTTQPVSTVPEPASLLLVSSGLAVARLRSRRSRRPA